MKKYFYSILILLALIAASDFTAWAQKPKLVTGQRRYDIIVTQANDTLSFNRNLRALRGNSAQLTNRGILTDLVGGYMTLGTSTLMSASQNLLGIGLAYLTEAARDKRPDWEKATRGECTFVKHLPSRTEVLDFYSAPSTQGAMDPTGMLFSGFGCRQYITILDDEGNLAEEEVFYLSCKLKDDDDGLARMLNHSKFEVVVDELRFNPYLCNLPNDTLSVDVATKIDFDFNKRKDLEFKVVANISSSWLNEAIQIARDVPLGQFVITAKIDPDKLDADNVFRYSRNNEADRNKVVTVIGDSFLVPRSYVGFSGLDAPIDTWGTGQYKVEMDISESCRINEDYYTTVENGKKKWNKEWKDEWRLMKRRPKRSGAQPSFVEMIFPSFRDKQWITTIIEPTTTVLMSHEGKLVNAAAGAVMGTQGASGAPNPSPASGGAGQKGKNP